MAMRERDRQVQKEEQIDPVVRLRCNIFVLVAVTIGPMA